MKNIKLLSLIVIICIAVFACKGTNENENKKENGPKVSSVVINEEDFSLMIGKEATLSVTVLPENAADKTLHWESDKPDVATVDQYGLIKAVSEGVAVITATALDGSRVSGSITITVTPFIPNPVQSIFINSGDFSLMVGESKIITVTAVLPADAGNKNVRWESDDTAVASVLGVGAQGHISAKVAGQANIKVIAVDGSGTFNSVKVTVTPRLAESVVINGGNFSLNTGAQKTLTVTVLPAITGDKSVKWESDKTAVATVGETSGLVTGVSTGTANIKATTLDGSDKSHSVQVTVTNQVSGITINEGNINLSPGGNKKLTVTVLPDTASNKNVKWSCSNVSIATVDPDGLVQAAFSSGTAAITATALDGSGVSDSVTVTVTGGGIMTAQEIFNALKGQKVTTNGWADRANGGAGLSYANPTTLTLIDGPNTTNAQFLSAVNNDNAKFIILSGDLDLSDGKISDTDKTFFDQFRTTSPYGRVNGDIIVNFGSNTTLIGINNARIKFGGIRINNKSNVIIRNVTFWDAHGSTEQDTAYYPDSKASIDALVVRGTSNGVWVDHCLFTNGTCTDLTRNFNHDGALDIPQGQNVTVSWNEFTNYDKVMLVAGDDSLTNVLDRQITLHHNYFHYTTQRMPRTRGTQMHIYNNYYNNIGVTGNTGYAMGQGRNAHFIVENNYFGSILSNKVTDYYDNATYPALVWSAGNNKTVARSSNDKTDGSRPWEPAYIYTLEPYEGLPTSVPPGAGPTLVFRK